jgi:8-oxo-dGTP pyrophosphatase MutT (NUDIX family)
VEAEDTAPDLLARLSGGDPAILGARMELDHDEREAGDAVSPPAFAFLAAALREAFEEAGILLAKPPHGCRTIALGDPGTGEEARSRLLEGSLGFAEVLAGMAIELDAAALEYIGRWITPEPEPWRYDTRFFAARVPPDCAAIPDLREMVEARWMRPGEALAHNQGGSLPLVFPTLRTLEALAGFDRADDFLRHHRGRRVPGLLPKLVVREGGIEIVTEEPGG